MELLDVVQKKKKILISFSEYFSLALKLGFEEASYWRKLIEEQPVSFLDRQLFPLMVYQIQRLGKLIGSAPENLCLVNNCTFGVYSVLSSLKPKTVFSLNIGYGAVKKMLRHIKATVIEAKVSLPIKDPTEILEIVKKELPSNVDLAIFDHVTSNTALLLPVKELVQFCHSKGVKVLIDGAHSLGSVSRLNLEEIDADYYSGNCHKWFSSPRGCGFVWKNTNSPQFFPAVISHGSGSGFVSEFMWDGNKDYSPFLSLSSVISFWENFGLERMIQHNHQLVCQAAKLMREELHTPLLCPESMIASMTLVELPFNYPDAQYIQDLLYFNHHIEVPIKSVDGKLYVRICSHIYNTIQEYKLLIEALKKVKEII